MITYFINKKDFMTMPVGTPQKLVTALIGQARLREIQVDHDDVLQITVDPNSKQVRIEIFPEVPF